MDARIKKRRADLALAQKHMYYAEEGVRECEHLLATTVLLVAAQRQSRHKLKRRVHRLAGRKP